MKWSLLAIGAAILLSVLLAAGLPLPTVERNGGTPPREVAEANPVTPEQPAGPEQPSGTERRQLFRPEDLPLLEGPDRALWQKPDLVMDQLGIADGSDVADIGAGAGWFTLRLARRVGPNGTVFAQDLQTEMVIAIRRRVRRENLQNVRVIQGDENSPHLPQGALDAVLVVDVYPEVKNPVSFLRSLAAALRPQGRIGIVNYKPGSGGPGPGPTERVESEVVAADARTAKLRVLSTTDLRYQYLVVIGL